MIESLLNKDVIEVNVEVRDWRDAVREGGRLLVQSGKVKESYVNGMIESVEKIGPYIVIAPGIAMPHARPEKGALGMGVSLLFLKDPIEFGNPDNDPVFIVISLSAKDNDGHLDLLADIMDLLENKEFMSLAKKHADKETILYYIADHFKQKGKRQT